MRNILLASGAFLFLAGCGTPEGDRAAGGALIGGEVSAASDKAIRKSLDDPGVGNHLLDDPAKPLGTIIGLTLGSPEFQMR